MSRKNQNWIFAHDSWFGRRDGNVYDIGALSTDVWGRYLEYASSLTVLARELPAAQSGMAQTLSSCPDVDFILTQNISSPVARVTKHCAAQSETRRLVSAADGVIARLPSEYGLLASAEAERAGKPWLVEMVGCPWDGLWNYGNWRGKIYAPIMAARTRRAVAKAPFVTYVTREFLQGRYPNTAGRIIACSDVEIDTPSEDVLRQRLARIARQGKPLRLGLIGTLKTRFKGIQTVFAALSDLRNELPSLVFHVLGPGDPAPWRKEAREYGIEDLVSFDTLRSPGEAVMAWLDDIDIYMQPSFKEGLPRATVEAMSRGCPVIGSTCAGIPELLPDSCCIKPGDKKHLARLIHHAVTSIDWQHKQAERNWHEAHQYSRQILNARRSEQLNMFAERVSRNKEEIS